jgi:hypothetical protein
MWTGLRVNTYLRLHTDKKSLDYLGVEISILHKQHTDMEIFRVPADSHVALRLRQVPSRGIFSQWYNLDSERCEWLVILLHRSTNG